MLTNDKFLSAKKQRGYAASLRGARVVEMDSGHMAPVSQPRAVAEIVVGTERMVGLLERQLRT